VVFSFSAATGASPLYTNESATDDQGPPRRARPRFDPDSVVSSQGGLISTGFVARGRAASLLRNNNGTGIVRRRVRRSPSPPGSSGSDPPQPGTGISRAAPPPRYIPTQLLEMGFSPRHIRNACAALGLNC